MCLVDVIYRQLRAAIEASDTTRYRLAKMTGVSQSQLAQFMASNKGLSVEAIERLVEALGLEIVIRPHAGKGGRQSKR